MMMLTFRKSVPHRSKMARSPGWRTHNLRTLDQDLVVYLQSWQYLPSEHLSVSDVHSGGKGRKCRRVLLDFHKEDFREEASRHRRKGAHEPVPGSKKSFENPMHSFLVNLEQAYTTTYPHDLWDVRKTTFGECSISLIRFGLFFSESCPGDNIVFIFHGY